MDPTNELTQIARTYTQSRTDNGFDYLSDSIRCSDPTKIILIYLFSDYDLNTVCHDICHEKTYKCIMTCDTTESECVYGCFRAEATCLESKFPDMDIIWHITGIICVSNDSKFR